jgi:hypothetical protein
MLQFGSAEEWSDMMLRGWLFVCSIISISPDSGQVVAVPTNQKAGHVPHLNAVSSSHCQWQHNLIHIHIRWQVRHVKDEEPMGIGFHALQTNRHTSKVGTRIQNRGSVDSPASEASIADFSEIDQAILLSRGKGDVINIAESRIKAFVEGEGAIEEVEALERVDKVEGLAVSERGDGEGEPRGSHFSVLDGGLKSVRALKKCFHEAGAWWYLPFMLKLVI